MPSKGHLRRWGKNAQARRVGGMVRLQHKNRFGQIELARDGLHPLAVEAIGVEHDGQRIAAEAFGRENIENVIVETGHAGAHACCGAGTLAYFPVTSKTSL